jgi:ABC-type Co2+ transport system permease subunit
VASTHLLRQAVEVKAEVAPMISLSYFAKVTFCASTMNMPLSRTLFTNYLGATSIGPWIQETL